MSSESVLHEVRIHTRRAEAADFEGIYSLYMDSEINPYLIFDPMSPDAFRPVFEELLNEREFYVYEEDGMVVAALTVTRGTQRMAHVASLGTIAVHLDAHGTGVGAALLSWVLARLAEEGVRRVDLTVDADNPGAIGFYESMGFHQEGVLHDYIRRAGEDDDVDNVLMAMLLA